MSTINTTDVSNITECFSNQCVVCVFIVSVRALTQYILVNISRVLAASLSMCLQLQVIIYCIIVFKNTLSRLHKINLQSVCEVMSNIWLFVLTEQAH